MLFRNRQNAIRGYAALSSLFLNDQLVRVRPRHHSLPTVGHLKIDIQADYQPGPLELDFDVCSQASDETFPRRRSPTSPGGAARPSAYGFALLLRHEA